MKTKIKKKILKYIDSNCPELSNELKVYRTMYALVKRNYPENPLFLMAIWVAAIQIFAELEKADQEREKLKRIIK